MGQNSTSFYLKFLEFEVFMIGKVPVSFSGTGNFLPVSLTNVCLKKDQPVGISLAFVCGPKQKILGVTTSIKLLLFIHLTVHKNPQLILAIFATNRKPTLNRCSQLTTIFQYIIK
jgi:hypothetical protein